MRIQWGRLARRSFALFLATVGVWLLLAGSGFALESGGEAAAGLAAAALRAELGPVQPDPLPFWARVAVEQSPLLAANPPTGDTAPAPTATAEALPEAQPAPDHDDLGEPPSAAPAERVVERTLVPTNSKGYVTGAGLYLYNRAGAEGLDLAASLAQPLTFTLAPASEGPQILIFHTHTTEAYSPDGEDAYVPSDDHRTLNSERNMIRVGNELERVFTELGLNVLHDTTLYDSPKYNGAYDRSGPAVKDYLERYPSLRLVLDVHRDALVDADGTVFKTVTTIDGVKTAQVMLVVGTDLGGGPHKGWRDNLALAARLQKAMDSLYPTLARPMTLRKAGYNQGLSPGALLVEVGSHGNTLQEALAGARLFARAAGSVFAGLEEGA